MPQNITIIKSQKSPYYGEKEKQLITLAVAWKNYLPAQTEGKQAGDVKINFYSGCSAISSELRKKRINTQKIYLGIAPIGIRNSILFTLFSPFLFILSLFFIPYLKFLKEKNTLILIDIPEKIAFTFIAKILGINVIWEEFYLSKRWTIVNPYRLLYLFLSRFAKIFTYSNVAKKYLVKAGFSKKTAVIYPGINMQEIDTQESIFGELNKTEPQNKKMFKIGTICNLSKNNGLEYLLQALKIITEIIPEAQLVIIGTGEERFNLNWLVRKLNLGKHIWFIGYQENYYYWLKGFDIFISPTLTEQSINYAIIEAMANFCPIIASNLEGIEEIVKNNLCGVLIEPANPEMLAQTVINLYRNKEMREELGKNSHKRVAAVFNIERMIDDFEKMF